MAQIQELIEKIKSEGIQAADQKAKSIQEDAEKKAAQIIDSAKKEADQIINHGKEEVKKMKESTQMALQQASRDTVLSVKKELKDMLHKIITAQVADSLTPEATSKIIETLVEKFSQGKSHEAIHLHLSAHDLKTLKDSLLAKLQKHVKNPVKISAAQDITKGFAISFDGGKSSFDFSDQSLANYISAYVNPEVANLLNKA